jgi:hypothetical protein
MSNFSKKLGIPRFGYNKDHTSQLPLNSRNEEMKKWRNIYTCTQSERHIETKY